MASTYRTGSRFSQGTGDSSPASSSSSSLGTSDTDDDFECFDEFDFGDVFDLLLPPNQHSTGPAVIDEQESAASSETDALLVVGSKRKRSRVPRVLKSDVRRHYANMIANVFNTTDLNVLQSFFRSFSIDKLLFKKHCLQAFRPEQALVSAEQNLLQPSERILQNACYQNIERMLCEWFFFGLLVPDQVMTIRDAKVLSWMHTKRSVVVIDTAFEYTRIFNINPKVFFETMYTCLVAQYHQRHGMPMPSSNTLSASSAASEALSKSVFSVSSETTMASIIDHHFPDPFGAFKAYTGHSVPLLEQPQRMKFHSSLRLILDENKCIETFEIGETVFMPL